MRIARNDHPRRLSPQGLSRLCKALLTLLCSHVSFDDTPRHTSLVLLFRLTAEPFFGAFSILCQASLALDGGIDGLDIAPLRNLRQSFHRNNPDILIAVLQTGLDRSDGLGIAPLRKLWQSAP